MLGNGCRSMLKQRKNNFRLLPEWELAVLVVEVATASSLRQRITLETDHSGDLFQFVSHNQVYFLWENQIIVNNYLCRPFRSCSASSSSFSSLQNANSFIMTFWFCCQSGPQKSFLRVPDFIPVKWSMKIALPLFRGRSSKIVFVCVSTFVITITDDHFTILVEAIESKQ